MSTLMDYAEALQTLIDSTEVFPSVQAGMSLTPEVSITGLEDLVVCVIPNGVNHIFLSRGKFQKNYNLDIGILQHIKMEEEQVALLKKSEQLSDQLIGKAILGGFIMEANCDPIYDYEGVRENNIVHSSISVRISQW